ncbi:MULTISPECIES: response regulator [Calothrix]|uniref:Response regulator n=2 Tax=Calothrix TaxID=1186 RepID=A0ABR8A9D3_9CYAN|nr:MULTISPECIES: response regulator [Calothrix]MBD2195893.1 response regulator [Calothrix parietina FACHB-288]MBD2227607.1 response regulator [Calothrix anomala FACHB-343]
MATQHLSLNGLKLLLVDTNSDFVDLIKIIFQEFSISVEVATSVSEALSILANGQVDCLISEIAFPREDGYSLMRKLRSFEKGQNLKPIPAIALTSFILPKGCDVALKAGFQIYATKPINLDDLLDYIAYVV